MKIIVSFVLLVPLLSTTCDALLRASSKLDQSFDENPSDSASAAQSGRELTFVSWTDTWTNNLPFDPRISSHLLAKPGTPRANRAMEDDGDRQLAQGQGQILSLQLINSKTDKVVATISEFGSIIGLDTLNMTTPSFNINATFNGTDIRSVRYGYFRNASSRIENTAPYAFCGNNKADFYNCKQLGLGTHFITATPYYQSNARGTPGPTYGVSVVLLPTTPQPPTLLNFTSLASSSVDVTNGDKTIDMLVTAVEATTGIDFVLVAYKFDVNRILSTWFFDADPTPIPGQPTSVVVPVLVKQFLAPGVYPFQLNVGTGFNGIFLDGNEISALGFQGNFTVVNTGPVDSTPPALLSFSNTSSLTVNTANSDALIYFQVTVQDNLSGFDFGATSIETDDPFARIRMEYGKLGVIPCCHSDDRSPALPANVPHSFTFGITIPKSTTPGEYPIEITLVDGVLNYIELTSTQLGALGLPSKIKVVG